MMETERYCEALDSLDKVEAIRAIHQAYLQLKATYQIAMDSGYDNGPAIKTLGDCLRVAGHIGFTS